MAIYELTQGGIKEVAETTFKGEKVQERGDLQRVLREQIAVVAPDCMVIAEEFGSWDDSQRRIDLLALDKDANLVVIELKRTEDGGHMELQALRYAAMVSAMTFEQAVDAHRAYLKTVGDDANPEESILSFLDWDEPNEDAFAQDVRLILVSADFSKELTTAVMWLNKHDLDIRCMRLKPYNYNGTVLLDVQQLIPLPEAADFQVRVKEKERKERRAKKFNPDLTKFDVTLNGETFERLYKRHTAYKVIRHLCLNGVNPEDIAAAIPWKKNVLFATVDGEVNSAELIRIRNEENSRNGSNAMDERRWFLEDDELIHLNGKTYSVNNQWGTRTEEALECLKAATPGKGWDYRKSQSED